MAKYTHSIRVPFSGCFSVSVESDEENPSKEALMKLVGDQYEIERLCIYDADGDEIEIYEWEYHPVLSRGNCFYGSLDEIEIDETKINE